MSPKGRYRGHTPDRVRELLIDAVSKSSQAKVAEASGLTRQTVQRYMQGTGEPSTRILQKLADYFGVTVAWLREGQGEALPELTELLANELQTRTLSEIASNVGMSVAVIQILADGRDRPSKEMLQRFENYFDQPIFGLDKGFYIDDKVIAEIVSNMQTKPEFKAFVKSLACMIKKDNPDLQETEIQAVTKSTLSAMVSIVKSEMSD